MKRSTLIAFAVLVALIGVVYWLERDGGGGSDVETVFDVAPDDIDRVEILRGDEEPVVIERVDNGETFRVIAPVDAACDPREVDLILSNLATLTQERTFAPDAGAALSEFGLESPRLDVRFSTADGSAHGIRFGNDTLTESNQYAARLGADDVLVVATHVSSNLDKSAWDLRDKAIFHIPDDAEPTRISITHGDETLVITNETGAWMTNPSPRARVDRFAVMGMVSRFRKAEMLDAAEPSVATGLAPPNSRLDVTFRGDHEAMALEVGDRVNVDYYARALSRSTAFIIEGGLVGELQRDPRSWWSNKLLHHPTTEATKVLITDAATNQQTLSRSEAQDLLRSLSSATADDIVTTLPPGDPLFVVTVVTDTVQDEITFRLENDVAFATRENEDVALRLSAETWTELANLLAGHTAPN